MISGGESRLIQLGGSDVRSSDNVACERTQDRIERERAEAALRKPVTRKHPWIREAEREQAQKDAERQARIKSGKLVIHANGGYTEYL